MTKISRYIAIVALCAAIAISPSCGSEAPDQVTAGDLLAEGKAALSQGRWTIAESKFDTVLQKFDAGNQTAMYGYSLAQAFGFLSAVGQILDIAAASLEEPAAEGEEAAEPAARISAAQEGGFDLIDALNALLDTMQIKNGIAAGYLATVAADPAFTFDIYPLTLPSIGDVGFDFSGIHGAVEAHFFRAMLLGLQGTANILLSYNFEINAFALIDELSGADLGAENIESFLIGILKDYPNLLTLLPDGGARITAAGEQLAMCLESVLAGAEAARARGAGTPEDVVVVTEDEGTSYTIAVQVLVPPPDDAEAATAITIESGDGVSNGIANLVTSLRTPGTRASWKNDIVPVIVPLVVSVLTLVPIDLPITISAGFVEDTINSLIGDTLEFDLGQIFAVPVGLRGWLPVYEGEAFILEYECPVPSGDLLEVCGSDNVDDEDYPVDTTHFTAYDSVENIEPDGVGSLLPYIAFGEPSFGGLLWVQTELPEDTAVQFLQADQRRLNKLIADIGEELGSVLSLLRRPAPLATR